MKRQARYSAALVAALLAVTPLVSLTGCGSGTGTRGIPGVTATRKKGSVTFSVRWPEKNGRVIPIGSQSIVLTLDRIDPGPTVQPIPPIPPLTPPPPTQPNPRVTTVTVGDLELGTYRITATAYPSTDGTGTPQAIGQVDEAVVADQVTNVSLTMFAEVRTLTVTPTTGASLYVGRNRQLVATAFNATNDVVLVGPKAIKWESSDTNIATVDANGLVTIVGPGNAQITATYIEPFTPEGVEGTGSKGAAFVTGILNVVDVGLMKSAWPKFHGNGQNTGQANFGNPTSGSQLWQFTVGDKIIFSSPALAIDGTVYVGAYDGKLYALKPDGTLKWTFTTGGLIDSSPAISKDGVVFFGSFDGKVYAVDAVTGTQKWAAPLGGPVVGAPAIGPDGTIYIGATTPDTRLYALNPTNGSVKWSSPTGGGIETAPAFSPDAQTIYVGSRDNNLYAINVTNGAQRWFFSTGNVILSSPAVAQNGTIYFGSHDGKAYALNPTTGNPVTGWPLDVGAPVDSSPAIDDEGNIYFGTFDSSGLGNNRFYSVRPDASIRWSFVTADGITSSPSIGLDGVVYFGSYDNNIYALNKDGSLKWTFPYGDDTDASPAIGPTGAVYIGGYNGRVVAIQ